MKASYNDRIISTKSFSVDTLFINRQLSLKIYLL